jgi:hypothetical protein
MNRSRLLLVLTLVLAAAVGQLSGAGRAYAVDPSPFTDAVPGLTGIANGSAAWGDYDSDGDLDILFAGYGYGGSGDVSKIYRKDTDGFHELSAGLTPVEYGSVAWGDYDSDGDLDILLTGWNGSARISKIYHNNGGVPATFTEIPFTAAGGLTGVQYSSVAWGDYNSDGKPDILLTGRTDSGRVSEIWENDGDGTFTLIDAGLTGVEGGSAAWGDYDSDGDLDILLTGGTGSGRVSEIWENDGDGTFSEDTGADSALTDVGQSSVAWGDYDSDGDLDILLTGCSAGAGDCTSAVTEIYENNGNGTFGENSGAGLTGVGVYVGSAAWGDYNSDGRPDILLTGKTGPLLTNEYSEVYRNNGGDPVSFTGIGAGLASVQNSSVAWGDYDSDLRLDILLAGYDNSVGAGISRVYQNGTATTPNTAPSAPTNLSASIGASTATLSWNAATDTEQSGSPNGLTYNVRVGTTPGASNVVAPMSRLSDGARLVPQAGNAGERTSYTLTDLTPGATYYWSVQAVDAGFAGSAFSSSENIFTVVFNGIGAGLPAVDHGSSAWGDYDSDGDLDILITGFDGSDNIAEIWKNKGDGTFEEDTTADVNLTGVGNSSVAWGDYDSDGDLDILLTGDTGSDSPIVRIYENANDDPGIFTFSEDTTAEVGLTGVYLGSVAWGDYNSDGKPDILLTGKTAGAEGPSVSKIYRNDGDGTFSDIGAGLTGVRFSSVAWGDYNADGRPDILLTGQSGSGRVSKIYRNDGNGIFTVIAAGLTNVYKGSVAWGDYDSDGDLDILLTGAVDSDNPVAEIYENNGDGSFDENTTASLTAVTNGSVAWGDYNADGKSDILLTGLAGSGPVSMIYKNNGDGTFGAETVADLTGVYYSSAAWGDYNPDGKLDILLTGNTNPGQLSSVYRNYISATNDAPNAPTSLSDSFASGVENLSWNAPPDNDETPVAALTYNLRVGTTSGGSDIVSPLSSFDGTRLVPRDGNVGERTSYSLTGLAPGTYHWGVQAVDQSFAGSDFITGSFVVPAPSFALDASSYSVNEGGGSVSVKIERSGSTAGTDTVYFATAGGSATVGSDYTNASQTVSFAPGETEKTVTVTITDDSSIEGNETVQLSLSGATLGSPSSATLTIVDNDRAVAFLSASYSVNEAGGTAAVTLTRVGSTAASDSVYFQTSNGTATAGSDYTTVIQTVSFAAGETSKTVSVPITDDSAVESSETVLLSLSSPSAGATLGTLSSATLTITDNDVAPPPTTTTTKTTPTPTAKGKITSCKLSKTSFRAAQAGKVKLTCKFSPKSKVFRYVLSLKKGKKWALVKSAKKTGSFKTYTITVKKLFAGKKIKRGLYRLKLSADRNSKTLRFTVK